MPLRPNASLVAWTAAVTVPLAALAVLAGVGIPAQKTAAQARLQDEAAAISASQARLIAQQLRAAIEELPQFPDPPVAVSTRSIGGVLDGTDLGELRRLRDDPDAGLSPSGLPRRALAALRIEALAPGTQDVGELTRLLAVEAPSVLTLPALQRLQEQQDGYTMPPAWQLILVLDELRAANPTGGWVEVADQVWWISADGKRFLPPAALSTAKLELPAYATARLASSTSTLTGSAGGELLARSPIDFPDPLALEWVLTSPGAVAAAVRKQTRWTLAVLGASLLVSACGLVAILRMVREERRLNRLKGQFVSSVSHELRAPLGSIQLMADALEDGRVESPEEFHRRIGHECQRLSHLVENVLDIAQIEEGRRRYRFEESDLATLVGEAADLFAPRAARSGHTLDIDLAPGRAFVDRAAVRQAVANLLDNALKFSPEKSTVSLALTWEGAAWSLAVSDQGPGIPPSEHARIFERFYRLGDELRRETGGTGIGLSVVKNIAVAHGGSVSVKNAPVTFTLTAPIEPPAQP